MLSANSRTYSSVMGNRGLGSKNLGDLAIVSLSVKRLQHGPLLVRHGIIAPILRGQDHDREFPVPHLFSNNRVGIDLGRPLLCHGTDR